jgi:hypothetical protein
MSGASTESEAEAENSNLLVDPRTGLAVRRTKIADEGMLMTWVRTVLSMIGFAIYKLKPQGSRTTDRDPKNVGLTLDDPSLMAASVQYWGSIDDPQSRVPFGRPSQFLCCSWAFSFMGRVFCCSSSRAPGCPF